MELGDTRLYTVRVAMVAIPLWLFARANTWRHELIVHFRAYWQTAQLVAAKRIQMHWVAKTRSRSRGDLI